MARLNARLIEHPERGDALVAEYLQSFADLKEELQPETLKGRPRILMMGSSIHDSRKLNVVKVKSSYQIYVPPAGVVNAADGWTGGQPEAERILAMDPDIIFFESVKESVQDFKRDPRWQGLKAVRENRVYKMPGPFPGILAGLHLRPLWVRWMAELTHPDRLNPNCARCCGTISSKTSAIG